MLHQLNEELDSIRLFFIENPICPICKELGVIEENNIINEKAIRRREDDLPEKYFYKILYHYQCPKCNHEWHSLEEFSTKRILLLENTNGYNLIWRFNLHIDK